MTDKEDISKTKDVFLFWKDPLRNSLTRNDEEFFRVIEENAPQLRKKYINIMKDLRALQETVSNGAILNSRKKRRNAEYELSLHLIRDNRRCFYLGGSWNFFVLDATADIDPVYDADYVEIADIRKCMTPIALKIVSVNVNTSKGNPIQMKGRDHKMEDFSSAVTEFINRRVKDGEDVLVITFKDDADWYGNRFAGVSYFGNTKGYNTFCNYANLAHICISETAAFKSRN